MMSKRLAQRVNRTNQSGLSNVFTTSNADLISFAAGFPDQNSFPTAALKKAFDHVFDTVGPDVLQYHDSLGLAPLREKVAAHLNATGTPANADHLLLTQGAQQGIDLASRLVLDKGDGLVVEAPTYIGALANFDAYEPTYYEVGMDDDGMKIHELKKILLQHDVKLLYTVPDYQNPTGTVMSLKRRHALIELANRYNFIILEDCPYRNLCYTGEPLPSLRSLDTEGRVINLGSFSKILAPGLRVGWLSADDELFDALVALKAGVDVETPNLIMQGINSYLDDNSIANHISHINRLYQEKLDCMLSCLAQYLPEEVTYTKPTGGFFIWITAPENMDLGQLLTTRMIPEGNVSYVPATNLFPSKSVHNQARLNFTGQSMANIQRGIQEMSRILKEALSHQQHYAYNVK